MPAGYNSRRNILFVDIWVEGQRERQEPMRGRVCTHGPMGGVVTNRLGGHVAIATRDAWPAEELRQGRAR